MFVSVVIPFGLELAWNGYSGVADWESEAMSALCAQEGASDPAFVELVQIAIGLALMVFAAFSLLCYVEDWNGKATFPGQTGCRRSRKTKFSI